ncbi:acyl-CoA dehydrogenase family protein [Microbispora sp. H11081]|uniref:acyl-CoA dehydrogenase family protein n=1 Tax=Microbispora sp. H11081 TaxID=2729107 RepID=UPI0014732695|nr:acyl-CoA dehydrogenase family protein [Microbispora sp. H11081]
MTTATTRTQPPGLWPGGWPDTSAFLPEDALAKIAGHAAGADLAGRPPMDSIALLKSLGWPGLPVPREFGGAGLGLTECCAVQRALGAADPALAVALNMHLFSVGLMVEHWRRRTDTSWLLMEAIATQNRLLASAFAEPNLGGSASRSTLTAVPVPGGWQASGTKRPCSLVKEADLVCLQLATDKGDGPVEVIVALLPTTAPGLSVREDWDTLGMRGSASNTLLLDRCVIPDELVFYRAPAGAEDDDILAAGVIWFALTSTACYLGLARAALDAGAGLLHRMRIAHLGAARAELPSYQATLGEHVAALLTLEAGCAAVAARMDAGADPQALLAAALAVKQQAVRTVPDLVAAVAECAGGVSYGKGGVLERLWRDAQAIRFHPPTPAAARQYLGRRALGLRASLDLDERSPGLCAPADSPRS